MLIFRPLSGRELIIKRKIIRIGQLEVMRDGFNVFSAQRKAFQRSVCFLL